MGDFNYDKQGKPLLKTTNKFNVFMDDKQRQVTKQGFLLDPSGNIIDN
jgi:hypothetical protein